MTDTHIKINAVPPKVQYTGNGSTTVFPYEFPIFDDSDMVVYFDDEVQESGYTVSGAGQTEGGNVTFATPPDDGVKITLYRNIPIERITDFQEGGTFRPKNLNDEFDRQTAFLQQVQETLDRSVKVGVTSDVDPEAVLTEVERLYESIDNVDAVADDLTNIDAVAGDLTNIDAVAGDLTNIDAVAGDLANVDAVAADLSNIDAVNANKTNIDAVAGNQTNIDAVAGNETNINAVAGNATNINAAVANETNINAAVSNETNINTVAGIASNVSTVASNDSNVTTVANNISDVNDCATNMSAIQDAPTQAANAAASAASAAISAAGTHFKLFHHDWFDYELNDMAWLRADTFSWQDGTVYSDAYNHLVDDIDGKTTQTETIAGHTITYTLADDGHKIVSDANASAVEGLYNDTGVAWYYILDLVNHRFKLPRENPAREELVETIPVVGNGTALGLLADTGFCGTLRYIYQNDIPKFGFSTAGSNVPVGTAATSWNTNNAFYNKAIGVTTNENNSGIIAKFSGETTKSVFKGHKYLYFYVGQFTQSATEQTAGLNSELFNGKVDLNAANLSTAGKSLISGLGMPSSRYDDLTLLASDNTYTAPANGYFVLNMGHGANTNVENISMVNLCGGSSLWTDGLVSRCFSNINGIAFGTYIPAKKGDIVTIIYNASGGTKSFRFYYAEGEENV